MLVPHATLPFPRRALAAGVCLALVFWLTGDSPLQAAAAPSPETVLASPPDPLFARYSLSNFLSGFANRSRVVQLAVVCMLIALAIMLKKFVDIDPGSAVSQRPDADDPPSRR